MKKIFISYSSKDVAIVQAFVDFLQVGMGMARNQIYCTAIAGMPRLGCEFMQDIRNMMDNSDVFISIITNDYLKSQMCLMELGIAWFLSKDSEKLFCPLLAKGATYEMLSTTPIRNIQSYCIQSEDDISSLYGIFYKFQVIEDNNIAAFLQKLPEFIMKVGHLKEHAFNEGGRIRMGQDGYYTAAIVQVRPVPSMYRCYRINGLAELPGEKCEEGETHWLFYRAGIYPDFEVGDRIRFKIEKTELRDFKDLKNARNIYPARLELV